MKLFKIKSGTKARTLESIGPLLCWSDIEVAHDVVYTTRDVHIDPDDPCRGAAFCNDLEGRGYYGFIRRNPDIKGTQKVKVLVIHRSRIDIEEK